MIISSLHDLYYKNVQFWIEGPVLMLLTLWYLTSKSGDLQVHAVYKNPYFSMHVTIRNSTTSLLRIHIWYIPQVVYHVWMCNEIGDLYDKIIITIIAQKSCSFLPSVLLFIRCTCQNTDGNKHVIFLCTMVIMILLLSTPFSWFWDLHYVYLQPTAVPLITSIRACPVSIASRRGGDTLATGTPELAGSATWGDGVNSHKSVAYLAATQ